MAAASTTAAPTAEQLAGGAGVVRLAFQSSVGRTHTPTAQQVSHTRKPITTEHDGPAVTQG